MKKIILLLVIVTVFTNILFAYTGGIRIAWDYKTLTKVFSPHAGYARMIRLQNGDILCSFGHGGNANVIRSLDDGKTWQDHYAAVYPSGDILPEVPELLQLQNGWILLAYNPRPRYENTDPAKRYAIKVAISKDNGYSWQHWSDVYEASHLFSDGIWEPAMIQLESGEVQLFASNEFPYQSSNEQDISVFRSFDNGQTFTDTVIVSFRAGHRDGMPVPIILQDNQGIVFSVEDNGVFEGYFKPSIIYTSLEDNWEQGYASGSSDRRWQAFSGADELPNTMIASAPYLRQLFSGETVISFQTKRGLYIDERDNITMCVGIGDNEAKNFSRRSYPFKIPTSSAAIWNSLFVKDSSTVTAVTGTDGYKPGTAEVYTVDGHIIPEMKSFYGVPLIDGDLSDEIWKQSGTMFIGGYSETQADFGTAWDEEHLYLCVKIDDKTLWDDSSDKIDNDDCVKFYFDAQNSNDDRYNTDIYKLTISVGGKIEFARGDGRWQWDVQNPDSIDHYISKRWTLNYPADNDSGYTIEVKLPWHKLGGRPETGSGWGINFELVDDIDGVDSDFTETVAGNKTLMPYTWNRIDLIDATPVKEITGNYLKQNFELFQNYPNPFNPITAISYRLSAFSNVELTVYNTLGQKVQILVNEEMPPGRYKVNFNGSSLASGIYYYILKTNNFVQTRKMLLLQ